jgi:dTDP-4-dehydrorhamnose 3,5-epimerase
MQVIDLPLAGLKLLRPRIFRDERGFFLESYQRARYQAAGVECEFVQDNHSLSRQGTLRGLHYQSQPGQAKLVRCTRGQIFDVAVDIRPSSPTFGRWHGVLLDDVSHEQTFVPIGFAHGFCVLSDSAQVQYKASTPYDAATECSIAWDDPDIGIAWPVANPFVSERDRKAESFAAFRVRALAGR